VIRRLLTLCLCGRLIWIVPTLLAGIALVPCAAATADAGSIVVANQNDSGPGSLRQAIADATAGEKVVVPAGMYRLSTGELAVTKSVTVAGAGAATTIIDGQTASRVFHTTGAGNQITISGVTIQNGEAVAPQGTVNVNGGGVLNEQATLTLVDDVITSNVATAIGAVANGASGVAAGGGVYSAGTLNLVDTDVGHNLASAAGNPGHAGGSAFGGGVFSDGALSIRGSMIEANGADAHGGTGGPGGLANGGGLWAARNGTTSISASTLDGNVAISPGGSGALGGSSSGGGAYLDSNAGAITETNVTVVGNIAQATGGQTLGGGVVLIGQGAGQSLTNATVSGNIATGGTSNQGGNVLVVAGDSAAIENSIVTAGEADLGSENCGVAGTLSSLGHNIDSRDQCNFHAAGDLVKTDAVLGALADNGGPVQTAALKPGSPAIDAGAAGACPSTDARGALRPAGGGCDIGAFELASPSASTAQADSVATGAAVLHGVASNPDLASGTAFFQYGTTTGYGSSTPAQPVGPKTAQLQVSAPLSGLVPGTTYHFRMVAHNAVGTVTGADRTFTTTPAVTGPGAPRLAVRSVSIAGATATVGISCGGVPGQRCAGSVVGRVREHTRGRSIVSLSADTRSTQRPAGTTTIVTVVSGNYGVAAGRATTLRIAANATGKQLLRQFYTLPAEVVFAAATPVRRTITFAYPRVKSPVADYWTWTLPPCAPCVTMVQRLTVTALPNGAHATVSCSGAGCPFSMRVLAPRRRSVTLAAMFKHSRLQSGTRLEVRITASNRIGEVLLYTIRTGTFPLAVTRCLPPGERVAVPCRTGS